MGINLEDYGSANVFRWTHKYLVNFLTMGKHRIIKQPMLKNAFRSIRRDDFVPKEVKEYAFEDRELDIGFGEVINKPTEVAQMLSLLKPVFGGNYLDIGTGSGWTAVLLAMSVGEKGSVYSLERVQFLVEVARVNLEKYPNLKSIVHILFRDGGDGLPDYAPFDGIHVSAAFEKVPKVLIKQLKVGGRMVIPTIDGDIRVITKVDKDEIDEEIHDGYYFKPMLEGVE